MNTNEDKQVTTFQGFPIFQATPSYDGEFAGIDDKYWQNGGYGSVEECRREIGEWNAEQQAHDFEVFGGNEDSPCLDPRPAY